MTITLDYEPTEKQKLFHESCADEVLYGGAAGGGKSKAIVMEAFIDALEHPGVHSYLFRKTYPELRDTLIKLALESIPKQLGSYNASSHDFTLKNGSVLHFRNCRNLQDAYTYQGAEMHRLYIDELTHFTQEVYNYLRTRVRAVKSLGVTPRIRCATNPGGVGHGWVKARYIDGKEPFRVHKTHIKSQVSDAQKTVTVQYIPAYATDNPHLTSDYIIELEQKPDALKKALLYGDWDVFEGQVFTEFTDNAKGYKTRKNTHVIEPFKIPKSWRRFRSFDWGYSKPFSVGYWALDNDGRLYRYAEIYGTKKDKYTGLTLRPNEGLMYDPQKVAQLITKYENKYEKGNKIIGIADPSIFDESRGSDGSVAKIFERSKLYFEPADNSRKAGKMQVHYRMRFDSDGYPMMYVFSTCKDFIRTMKTLVYDIHDVEDIDTQCEDHIYDETRYVCMRLPIIGKEESAEDKAPQGEDPLNMFERPKPENPYGFSIKYI